MKPGPVKQFDPEVALRAAIEVFRERGYEGASLTQLTAAMAIGKKSLYDTFGNKRALFLKGLKQYGDEANEMIRETLSQGEAPLENLRELLGRWQRASAERSCKGCLIGTNLGDFDESDEDVVEILNGHLQRTEEIFQDALERAQKRGELSPKADPASAARMLVCLTQGSNLIGRISQGDEPSLSSFEQVMLFLTAD